MDQSEQEHFDRIAERYRRAAASWRMIYDQFERHINPLVAGKDILDIGNGGHFAYDKTLPREIMVMDVSPRMLERIEDSGIVKLVGDARDLSSVEDDSVDVILFILCLHHINDKTAARSCQTLDKVLKAARRKLHPHGRLIVAEAIVSPWIFTMERILFRLVRRLLSWLGVSMVFFYPLSVLRERIAREFDLDPRRIGAWPIEVRGKIDPLGGTFPGLISIPGRLHPLKHWVLIAPAGSE